MLDDMLLSSVQQSIVESRKGSIMERKGSNPMWRNSLVSKAREIEHRNSVAPKNVEAPKKEAWPSYETPSYIKEPGFQEFLDLNQVHMNEGTGYMFMRLERDHPQIDTEPAYYGGETIRGSLFFELFHPSV